MGLVYDDGKYVTLTDILGAEDAFGDMDFKVAGTRTRDGVATRHEDRRPPGRGPVERVGPGQDGAIADPRGAHQRDR